MQHHCSSLVLCGDHKQLPATVLSKSATKHLYNRSLFERLYQSGHPVHFLDKQYRCHPDIYGYPSSAFYSGNVENGRSKETFQKYAFWFFWFFFIL